ncbi:TPA: DUF551 domain-containing protein [Klebsiella pneumoniae]|nr:DUF551 domain-containing protein [Klebsiella pneumoniae]
MAAFRLAAMDSSESVELPLDYLQGHKDGLEWAAQLAEANHPEKGDWLYDDPIELAKAIRKGPDMPPAQPVADSEPVIVVGDDGGDALSYRRLIQSFEPGTKLYRHAQPAPPAPVVSADLLHTAASAIEDLLTTKDRTGAGMWFDLPFRLRSAANAQPAPVVPDDIKEAVTDFITVLDDYPEQLVPINRKSSVVRSLRAAMLAAAQHDTPALNPVQSVVTVPGKWIPVSERMPEVGVKVLCFPAEDEPIHAVFNGQLWLQDVSWSGSEEPIDNVIPVTVTHWMPLPAGPQEVR